MNIDNKILENNKDINMVSNKVRFETDREWTIERLKGVYQDIVDAIPFSKGNNYFLCHVKNTFSCEDDKYYHVFFLFNYVKDEVLVFVVQTETTDSDYKDAVINRLKTLSNKKNYRNFFILHSNYPAVFG